LKRRKDKCLRVHMAIIIIIIIIITMFSSPAAYAKKFCSAESITELELHIN